MNELKAELEKQIIKNRTNIKPSSIKTYISCLSNLIKKTVESDKSISIYDRFGFPISRILDRLGGKFLFGKNILVVARKS